MEDHFGTTGLCLPIHFQILSVWKETLEQPIPSVLTSFFECGGSPLLAERMLDAVAAETGHRVSMDTFARNPTIAGLSDALIDRIDLREIVEVQEGRGETPLFYFHGDIMGGGFYARPLAEELGSDWPFYSVPMPPVSRRQVNSVEEIASRYCERLRELRPSDSYAIGGFSLGATIAYEVARQLAESGNNVCAVILIDPDLPSAAEQVCLRMINSRPRDFAARVGAFTTCYSKLERLHYLWHSPWHVKADFISRKGAKMVRGPENVDAQEETIDVARDPWRLDVFQYLVTAYQLKPFEGPVAMMLTEPQVKARPKLARKWHRAAPRLTVHPVPGSHMTVITTRRTALVSGMRKVLLRNIAATRRAAADSIEEEENTLSLGRTGSTA